MELRVLNYFLTVAKEESISKAAEALHLSQPTLSRQLKNLEDDVGKILLIRGNKKTTLTDEGRLLQKRAQEIIDLAQKAKTELKQSDTLVDGDVWIGGVETDGMRLIARVAQSLQKDFPNIHVHFFSGNTMEVVERLEKGLVDFAVGIGAIDLERYYFMRLPVTHEAGLLMRKDSPLALKKKITPNDFQGIPIIAPRNERVRNMYAEWLGRGFETLNVVASYNLIFNAAFLVEEGVGYALCIDRLITSSAEHPLCFIPYDPPMKFTIDMAWKKNQVFSKASHKFLERLREVEKSLSNTKALKNP
jgi:DNA-binding transcriptional LysR family regulator